MTDVTPTVPRAIPPGHSLCYVVGWPSLGAIKIGNAATVRRVKRWTSMRDGRLLRLDILPHWTGGCLRETELADVARRWPRRWSRKDQAAPYLGSRTDGWTEFYAVPVEQWPDFLTALEVHP